MQLGRLSKLNVAVAILLCMAFALDIGAAVAGVVSSLLSRGGRVIDDL